ncbi:MAG: hypothetical protein Q7S33_02240 [Nanoarchaeota archaeon]|nr:hypothetical protein [Nanoarchaeota archaeon]
MNKAKGYEAIGIELEDFLKRYKPNHWKEPLGSVFIIDSVMPKTAKEFVASFQNGTLPETLKKQEGFFDNPNVAQAVKEFFDKGDYKKYLKE